MSSSSSSASASATSKLTTASPASASSRLTASSASASCMLTTASASASSTLTASASASSMLTTATPTLKRTASNTSLDSECSQDPAMPAVHKRIHLDELSDEASSSSDNDSGDSDLDDGDYQEEEDAVWEMMAPNVWDALSGAHCNKTIKWKKEKNDLVEVFGADSEIMTKLQGLATGAIIKLVDGKVLEINGPVQKVDHLVNVMQRLLVVFGPSTKNYIVITVGGTQLSHHLAALQQTVGSNGRVVAEANLHFSVCKTDGEWSAVQVADLGKYIAAVLAQAPQSIHSAFICDNVAFFNATGNRPQVLGVCPLDEASPIHELIAMLQDALQQKRGLIMETTTHATIISRKKGFQSLANILTPLISGNHDWMGPLAIQKVAVSRFVTSLHLKMHQYFTLWEVDV